MSQGKTFLEYYTQAVQQDRIDSDTLKVIATLLQSTPKHEIQDTLNSVGLGKLFDKLHGTTPEDVDITCDVLELCFRGLNLGFSVNNYSEQILHLLKTENPSIRKLAIYEIHRTVMGNPSLLPLPEYINIYIELAHRVGDSDLGVAAKAIEILNHVNLEGYPQIIQALKVPMDGNSSSRCNAYEAIINISSKSEEHLKICSNLGFFDRMLGDLKSNDILYQMNILELLSRLALTDHGISYLLNRGILKQLSESLSDLENNPLDKLLIPGYMKFFGSVAHKYPKEIANNYPIIVESLFNTLESDEKDVLPVALDTLGFVGSTVEGKLCLAALGDPFILALKRVGRLIVNSPTEIKIRALSCMEGLIAVKGDRQNAPIDQRVTLMTREWFKTISDNPLSIDVLYTNCKNPFPDIQTAAFGLLHAICQYNWGHECVASTPGFIEFLLDRAAYQSKENKELKYRVIERLSNSGNLDPSIVVKLKTYVDEGPYFREQNLEVAMEEGQ